LICLAHYSSLAQSKPDWRWQLTASGRFAHRKEYVLSLSKESGFAFVRYEPLDGFRYERGAEVRGHLFVLQKKLVGTTNEL
jgi:predicted TPR repeat methyltransferase